MAATRFPNEKGLKLKSKNKPKVCELQDFLQAFGYLRTVSPSAPTSITAASTFMRAGLGAPPNTPFAIATPGEFDEGTQAALQSYQSFHGLPETGVLDAATIAHMSQRRCGIPDLLPSHSGPEGFEAPGNKWPTMSLTYSFHSTFAAVIQKVGNAKGAIRAALDLWSDCTPLKFNFSSSTGDIVFHAIKNDGVGKVVAYAWLPAAASTDGQVFFDVDEDWADDLGDGIDLASVAAHELGHALGLKHSQLRSSLMYSTYGGPQQFLDPDDIAGIQSLYGSN